MKPLIPQTVLEVDKIKLHQDLVNVIGLNISEGILACAGMVNEKILSKTKENQYVLSKEQLTDLLYKTWEEALDTAYPLDSDKENYINNLLNQQ